ncbi:TetR/AcrR family transcriptional regulator [Agrococcus baldri]|uniref:Transcriptional regulator, TetR family protein n=1 Tax=Agrococcus baldri TaxID=153730 RepID=A0AA87URJ3_9MICO|nr:TetR family transcriptional regulator [Agrococcus baldri]GEK80056.1 putative transcriptional regulator, TetR family protein [Agrococcus baldri]
MVRKPAEERRRDLVEAGLRVIARQGMHAATVRTIVAEAGVPLATFHYVFDSRDEMIGEAYAYVVLPRPGEPPMPFERDATPVGAVRAVLLDWVDRFAEHPEYELAVMEIMAYCMRTPSLAHLPAAVQARYVELVTGIIADMCAHLGLEPARPLEELSQLVLHVTDGLTYCMLRTGDAAASRRFVDEAAPMLAAAVIGDR